jgi:excinuclease UvrABC ATPase subunit
MAQHTTTTAERAAIRITGARENNLRNLTLEIPRRAVTVFTGVSGSGKSSLVFDTVAAEAQRQLNETFTTFVRNRLPRYGQPDLDAIENLSAPVVIDQKPISGNSRSTVGTITDISPLLRLLFSRVGSPHVGASNAFSFNDPQGMCPHCDGLGRTVQPDEDKFFDRSKSLNEGALLAPGLGVGQWAWHLYARSGLFDLDKKLADYTDTEWKQLLYGGVDVTITSQSNGGPVTSRYEGVLERFTRLYINRDAELADRTRRQIQQFVTTATCLLCNGARLNQAALSSRINGRNIAELSALEATELVGELRQVTDPAGATIVASLLERVGNLVDIGLGYLSLDRATTTLSGGEAQRIKTVRHLSSSLTEMLYIFDEPSVGLHPRDVHRLTGLLRKLRDKGNTVLVVEHDRDVIETADHVIDLGPGAGTRGGQIVYQGDFQGLRAAQTPTGAGLRQEPPLKPTPRQATGALRIDGATLHNLKNVTVDIPTGVLTVVTGVAGSGKSTLVNDVFLAKHPDAVAIDQAAVATSRRSNPATYTGMLDTIRQLFARANDVSASLFSSNSKGACPNCQGLGVVYLDLAYMDGLKSVCEVCGGRRFSEEVLAYRLRGASISDVLEMTAAEALGFFTEPTLRPVLRALNDVGLDYLKLGQPLTTLSGGELMRLKLATELHKSGSVPSPAAPASAARSIGSGTRASSRTSRLNRVYVMDEPTTGLHMADIGRLLEIVERLVDQGNTVVVIEHNPDVVKQADWVIDLGPEGGHRGGEVLFTGIPRQLLDCDRSITARYLRQHV